MPFGRLLAIATGSSRLRVFCSNPLHACMPILVQTTHSSKRGAHPTLKFPETQSNSHAQIMCTKQYKAM